MRRMTLGVAALAVAAGGCVTVAPQSASFVPPSAVVTTLPPLTSIPPRPSNPPLPSIPALPTAPPAPTAAPLPSSQTLPPAPSVEPATPPPVYLTVTFVGGPNAGTYPLSGDPGCSYGVIGDRTWALQYGNLGAGANELSTVQLQIEPDSTSKSKNDFIVSGYFVVGPVFGGTGYTLSIDRFTTGNHVVQIDDQGSTATIHVAGKSAGLLGGDNGTRIDLAVSCPSVNRG